VADGIELAESVHSISQFLVGSAKPLSKGPLWCDNRGAVLCGRKGPYQTDEIPKRTRHVALRFARVLTAADRLWFCPTTEQKADGLTKSCNPTALRHIFVNHPKPVEVTEDDDEDAEDENLKPVYMAFLQGKP
jgi:hypothetical protein